jgi:hypothetical protein
MIDYIISAILVIFIITVLVYLRRRDRGQPAKTYIGPGDGPAKLPKRAEHTEP